MALTGETRQIGDGYGNYDTFQPSFVTLNDALTDFDGNTNTRFILSENGRRSIQGDTATYAAPYAKGYVFPDGITTNGYILSVGQWSEVFTYGEEVCRCLTKVGGLNIVRSNWASTYYRGHSAYPIYYWATLNSSYVSSYQAHAGYRGIDGLNTSTRPCTDYTNKNPIIIK